MKLFSHLLAAALLGVTLAATPAAAADYPAPQQAQWTARNVRFHTGEVMPELRIVYTTVGKPQGEPVLVLNGNGGLGTNGGKLGIYERELPRVKGGRLLLIPASADTRGHGTTGLAKFYKDALQQLLQTAPRLQA